VCAFANTEGGLLLYGVGETDGRMDTLDGCELRGETMERFTDRLERIIRSGLDPAFGGMSVKGVRKPPDSDSSPIVVGVGVERSTYAPHRVTFLESRRFMLRMMKSTVEMDTEQIREQFRRSFIAAEDATERLNQSKTRFAMTTKPELAFPTAQLWIAVAPLYRRALSYPLRSAEVKTALEAASHSHSYLNTTYVHFDHIGAFLRTHSLPYPLVRLNRDGTIERTDFVDVSGPSADPAFLGAKSLRERLIGLFASVEELRRQTAVAGPALVLISLRGIKGLLLSSYKAGDAAVPAPFTVDVVSSLFELADEGSFGKIRKDAADYFWQSAGHRECVGFDEDGAPIEP